MMRWLTAVIDLIEGAMTAAIDDLTGDEDVG